MTHKRSGMTLAEGCADREGVRRSGGPRALRVRPGCGLAAELTVAMSASCMSAPLVASRRRAEMARPYVGPTQPSDTGQDEAVLESHVESHR